MRCGSDFSILKRVFTLVGISFLLATCSPAEENRREESYNLLFILTDEQRFDTSSPYGNEEIKTPNLNKLGTESVVFERAYVAQPVCSPARATLMTGLFPHAHGVVANNIPLDTANQTLPEMAGNEYVSAYMGKWHLGRELDAWQGFDLRVSTEDGYTIDDTTRFSDYHQWLIDHGYTPDRKGTFSRNFAANLPYEHTKSKFTELQALEFLEAHQQEPFILYLSFLEPHSPYTGPFNALHDTSQVELNPSFSHQVDREAPLRHHMKNPISPDKDFKEAFVHYWGLVHQVDLSVGAILAKLQSLGLDERTIVVFTSEHGNLIGEHGLQGKAVMYDPASRVPWFLRIPNMGGQLISQPVSQVDMVPTLLDAMGKPVPSYLHGKSLLPKIRKADPIFDPVFMEWNTSLVWKRKVDRCPEWATEDECLEAIQSNVRTVVTPDGWKLNWAESDRSQMFNLNEDPLEMNNLFESDRYKETRIALQKQIREWQKRVGEQPWPM